MSQPVWLDRPTEVTPAICFGAQLLQLLQHELLLVPVCLLWVFSQTAVPGNPAFALGNERASETALMRVRAELLAKEWCRIFRACSMEHILPLVSFCGGRWKTTFAPMDWHKSKGVPDCGAMNSPTPAKRLHEMNALEDMGQFPLMIYAGATGNVLATLTATWFLHQYTDDLRVLWLWAVGIIVLNLSPVGLLRLVLKNTRDTPPIREMNFFRDQHRFASWVYAVASGNLFFWIVTAWCVFSVSAELSSLLGLLGTALVVTSFPAWLRLFRKS